jgi:peroxiredoxin-like protein
MEPHTYNVNVEWTANRKGLMSSPELTQTIEVATPPQFPKGVENVWSPEHLFTAAVSSCFMTTFLAIAENSKLEFNSLTIKSKGILEQIDGKLLITRVELYPILEINHEKDRERAERILQKSEAACLISNSIKSEVKLQPTIAIATEKSEII